MSSIKDFFFGRKKENWTVQALESKSIEDIKTLMSLRVSGKQAKEQYKKLYEKDGLTFMLVNYLDHKIAGQGFYFDGDSDLVNKLEEWSEEVGLKFVLKHIVKDAIIYGTAWVELVLSEDYRNIEDFRFFDPTKMDFARDNSGKIKLDENGEPLCIVQEEGLKKREWYKDRIEENGKIIIKAGIGDDFRKHIAYFKLESYGDDPMGLSLIAPIYRSAIIRSNISDMVGEAAYRGGGIVAYLSGNPPEEVKKKLAEYLKNITSKNIFVFSDKIRLDLVPIPDTREREGLIYYLADEEASTFGIPLDVLMCGVKSYRQDLPSKLADMEARISSYQEYLAFQFNKQVIDFLLHLWKTDKKAKLVFRTQSPSIKLSRSRRIATLARRGLIRYDPQLELHLRREEGLPVKFVQLSLKQWQEEKKSPEEIKSDVEIIAKEEDEV